MKDLPEPPSEEFLRAFSAHVGTIMGACGFCGRIYFNGADANFFNEHELTSLRANAESNPDRWIETGYSISFIEVGGTQYVDGCRCNAPSKYEDWIWTHRREIANYLNVRAEAEFQSAEQTRENVKVHRLLKGDEIASDILERA